MTRTPNIEIDPVAFTRHGVDAVPAMIAERARTGESVLRVDGGTSVAFLMRAFQDLEKSPDGPRGTRVGSVTAIEEQDLVERAKTALLSLDLDGMRRDALERAFSHMTADREHDRYPVAEVHRRRIVDPTVEVAAPIGGAAADHLSSYVRAGTRINPLDMRPFTQVLVILDPAEPAQRAAVETSLAAHLAAHPGRRATWIATRLDAEAGGNGSAAIEGRLGAPVYLIDDRLSSRFQIERIPSLVYAENRAFVVEKYRRSSSGKQTVPQRSGSAGGRARPVPIGIASCTPVPRNVQCTE